MDFMKMLGLQLLRDAGEATDAELKELEAMELEWHNAALTDSHDIPVRA